MPEVNSRKISDAQQGIHKNLEKVVRKHCENPNKKPISQHTQAAFDKVAPEIEASLLKHTPLIFDSFCGTAMSSKIIAENNPQALVIGIDRSTVRLAKTSNNDLPRNLILVQAECADFWTLAYRAGWTLLKHTILYPNPYPKSKHLKRRWHAHPAYPVLLALGGEVELRTNWKVYADEFCAALEYANKPDAICSGVKIIDPEQAMTLFEKKYQQSGQVLYRCIYSLY